MTCPIPGLSGLGFEDTHLSGEEIHLQGPLVSIATYLFFVFPEDFWLARVSVAQNLCLTKFSPFLMFCNCFCPDFQI